MYIITSQPDGTIKNNSADEAAGKSKNNTGVIAGGITGAILFVIFVVVIVLLVQRKILKSQHNVSFKVKKSCLKYSLSEKID